VVAEGVPVEELAPRGQGQEEGVMKGRLLEGGMWYVESLARHSK
jgi:hypothetical protein